MGTNIEWKARARDPERQRHLAAEIADGPPQLLEEADTFFTAPGGRLKLPQQSANRGELIFYQRPDQAADGGRRWGMCCGVGRKGPSACACSAGWSVPPPRLCCPGWGSLTA